MSLLTKRAFDKLLQNSVRLALPIYREGAQRSLTAPPAYACDFWSHLAGYRGHCQTLETLSACSSPGPSIRSVRLGTSLAHSLSDQSNISLSTYNFLTYHQLAALYLALSDIQNFTGQLKF